MPPLTDGERVILDELKRIEAQHQANETRLHDENRARLEELASAQRRILDDTASLRAGFPNGDPDSHRRYHESVIEWRELRNKMVRDALTNAAKVGFLAGAGWFLYALWIVIKMEFQK